VLNSRGEFLQIHGNSVSFVDYWGIQREFPGILRGFSMSDMIRISGLDKAAVLQALFNASKHQGMGFLDPRGASDMTIEDAKGIVDHDILSFDYLRGRVMKVDISGDNFCPRLYDRDNGDGAAARALAPLLAPAAAIEPEYPGDVRKPEAGCWHIINSNWNSTSFGPDYCRKPCVPGTLYCDQHPAG